MISISFFLEHQLPLQFGITKLQQKNVGAQEILGISSVPAKQKLNALLINWNFKSCQQIKYPILMTSLKILYKITQKQYMVNAHHSLHKHMI
ncbi:UNKNOWN [Stylonychia lemnae]|uniref:Uncharacterized protein n=1 Tax=Stylonychia lemnae TaxID=5949 RepID=A0A077ZV13_STYLE|nr:UNKNOWN [Stylonychia lemnae]|eukprot:CDW73434.1 UNKNOWN [Stylonychia lemnae]